MAHALLMNRMTPDAPQEGTVMVADGALSISEVEQRIKEAMECLADASVDLVPVYLVPGHPTMRLDVGFVELVSHLLSLFPYPTLPHFWILSVRSHSPASLLATPIRRCRRTQPRRRLTAPRPRR